jgi:toxin ParE1/3/4
MKVVLHEAALRELHEAVAWYADRGVPAEGARLMALVDQQIAEIGRAPESFPRDPQRPWARRARILGWPHTLVFVVHEGDAIVILALAHGRRRPGYWARGSRR